MFGSLDGFLVKLASEGDLWYCPNPGNAGDALIAAATWQRFRKLGIRVRAIPRDGFDASGRNVLFGGGGNLVPMYRQAAEFLQLHHRKAKHIALLPHTIDGHRELLGTLGKNTTLFCREEVSYAHCLQAAPGAACLLSHDLAIGLDPRELVLPTRLDQAGLLLRGAWVTLRRGKVDGPGLAEIRRVLEFARSHGVGTSSRPPVRSTDTLDAFRQDAESGGRILPPGNLDLSRSLELHGLLEGPLTIAAKLLLGALRGYRRVRTDRLHVCIAAALQDIEVEFHANSYFKCLAIWEHSLRQRFPSIRWMG